MKKPTKRAVLSIVAALLVIVGGVVFALLQNNTKTESLTDYQQAQTATAKLRTSYVDLENSYYAYSVATPPAKSELEALTAKLNDYKTAAAKLTYLKALQSGELHTKYQSYTAKNSKYLDEVNGFIKDRGLVVDLQASECYKKATSPLAITPDVVTKFEAIYKECQTTLAKLQASDSASLKAYADAVNTYFTERKAGYEELTKAIMGTAKTTLAQAVEKVNTMKAPDANKEIQTAHGKASLAQTIQDLANQVAKQAVKAKTEQK